MLFDKKTIRWKLFIYYFLLFAVFTFSIILFQNKREEHFKIVELETILNEYTDITDHYIVHYSLDRELAYSKLDSLKNIIPSDKARITVISFAGKVLYDNSIPDYSHMENHKERPEVQKALYSEFGENIRHSATTNQDYIYYAKAYKKYIVRAAIVLRYPCQSFSES